MVLKFVFFSADGVFTEEGSEFGNGLLSVSHLKIDCNFELCKYPKEARESHTRENSFVEPYWGVDGLVGVVLYEA